MKTIIKNGTAVLPEGLRRCDIALAGSVIERIAEHIKPSAVDKVIDAAGMTVMYGLADVHVHLREPGFSAKETIATGSAAAAHGGYTIVCSMPNLNPAPDTLSHLEEQLAIIRSDAVVKVLPYATITTERKGVQIVDMATLKPFVAGFSDDGSGVQNDAVMRYAMSLAAATDVIIAAHCEDNTLLQGGYIHQGEYARMHSHAGICSESEWGQIARDVKLAAATGCRYHVCHISTAESVEVIRRAKAAGVRVTCETAPHYLTLTDADLQEDGRFKMNPPLRSERDREALLEGIVDGTIDMIATDHAPHTAEEKSRGLQGSAMGVVGLETAFAVLYTKLVLTDIITLPKLVELMSAAPRRVFRLGGALRAGEAADLTIMELDTPYVIDPAEFLSKGRSTPFEGWRVHGRTVATIVDGKTVYENNKS